MARLQKASGLPVATAGVMAAAIGLDVCSDFGPALIVVSKEGTLEVNEKLIIDPL